MQGSFSSQKQARADSSYYNINLHLAHIWPKEEAHWLYAEYGVKKTPNKPYAQRIYQLETKQDGKLYMHSYDLKNQEAFIGKWKKPAAFDSLDLNELVAHPGCSLLFHKNGKEFTGETQGKNCKRTLGNTAYSTYKMTIAENEIMNLFRGFDKNDTLVWGKPKSGYVLKKQT